MSIYLKKGSSAFKHYIPNFLGLENFKKNV
jgi:hypothetical protein